MTSLEETIAKVTAFYSNHAPYFHQVAYADGHSEWKHARLKEAYRAAFAGHAVLEIAAGSGYWTEAVASTAKHVLATDVHENLVAVIRQRLQALPNVGCQVADAYSLAGVAGSFTAAFAQYWWSHIPKRKLQGFLDTLHAKLQPGALVFFSDDLLYHIEGMTRRTDDYGDIHERRPMRDGTHAETLKNFPTEQELIQLLEGVADDITYQEYEPEHIWTLSYRLRR